MLLVAYFFEQVIPAGRCVTDAELLGNVAAESALLKIANGLAGFGVAAQLLLVKIVSPLQQIEAALALFILLAVVVCLGWDLEALALGQGFYGFAELESIVLHHKAECVAACTAAKAVKKLFFRINAK